MTFSSDMFPVYINQAVYWFGFEALFPTVLATSSEGLYCCMCFPKSNKKSFLIMGVETN